MLPDTTAGRIQWRLSPSGPFRRKSKISCLFVASRGKFARVCVYRPAGEPARMEQREFPAARDGSWVCSRPRPALTDPLGTQRASVVENPSPGARTLQQTLGVAPVTTSRVSAFTCKALLAVPLLCWRRAASDRRRGPCVKRAHVVAWVQAVRRSRLSPLDLQPGRRSIWGLQVEAQPYPPHTSRPALLWGSMRKRTSQTTS